MGSFFADFDGCGSTSWTQIVSSSYGLIIPFYSLDRPLGTEICRPCRQNLTTTDQHDQTYRQRLPVFAACQAIVGSNQIERDPRRRRAALQSDQIVAP